MDDSESDNESNDTPLSFPFLILMRSEMKGEVINELNEYENAGSFYRNRIINRVDGNDLAFPCMIVLEDIEEFIVSDMADVVIGRPFRAVS
ncbi:hypothetical protein Tco_1399733 [Tanacetum coccineum]